MDNNIADSEKRFHLFHGNVSEKYKDWPSPDVIISDGAYGVGYLANKQNGKYQFLDCSHYVHNIAYQQIYEESIKFINQLK